MIKVCEHFYTIQGEGPLVGKPSYLIRLTGCQLNCSGFCDSSFSWSEGVDLKDIIDDIRIPDQCKHIIITGGEPTIHFHKNEFKMLLSKLNGKFLEIETTALPVDISSMKSKTIDETLCEFNRMKNSNEFYNITTYRISPKLDLNITAYRYHSITKKDIFRYYKVRKELVDWNFTYKIVYSKEYEEVIKEFLEECIKYEYFRKDKLFIMPLTPIDIGNEIEFRDKYKSNCEETIEFCKKYGLRYTPRIHIDVYGLKRGF